MLYQEVYKKTLAMKKAPQNPFLEWVEANVFWNNEDKPGTGILEPIRTYLSKEAQNIGILSASIYAFDFLLPEKDPAFSKLKEFNWKREGVAKNDEIDTALKEKWKLGDVSDAPSKTLIDDFYGERDLKGRLYSKPSGKVIPPSDSTERISGFDNDSIPGMLLRLFNTTQTVAYVPACAITMMESKVRQVPMLSLMLWLEDGDPMSAVHELLPALTRTSDFLCGVYYSAELHRRTVAAEMYGKIEQSLKTIKMLREPFKQLGVELEAIETVINPYRFLRGTEALKITIDALKEMYGGNKHNVKDWGDPDIAQLISGWKEKCASLGKELSGEYDSYFKYFHNMIKDDKTPAYILKALKDGACPMIWVKESSPAKKAITLDNKVTPLSLALAMKDTKISTEVSEVNSRCSITVFVKDDGRSLLNLKSTAVMRFTSLTSIYDLTSQHTSGILMLLAKGASNGREALEAACVEDSCLKHVFLYPTKEVD